jgi:hypothetical protein
MRLAILVGDNMVVIDGKSETVDLTGMPEEVRAVQWDGAAGHVEYHNLGEHRPNELLDSIDDYQWVIDAWEAAAAESEKEKQALQVGAAKLNIEAKHGEKEVDQENLARLAVEAEAQAVNAGKSEVHPLPDWFPPPNAPKVPT